MKKQTVRIICLILAAIMAIGVLTGILSTLGSALTSDRLEELEAEKKKHEQELKEIRAEQERLKKEKNSLQKQISAKSAEISSLQNAIQTEINVIALLKGIADDLDHQITDKKAEIRDLQQQQDTLHELYCTRLRAMEENGAVSYYSIIFGASSFSDMLFRLDAVAAIRANDESIYSRLVAKEEETREAQLELEQKLQDREDQRIMEEEEQAFLVAKEAELQKIVDELTTDFEGISEEIRKANAAERAEEKAREEFDKQIKAEEALLREIEERSKVKGTGKFIWPLGDFTGRVTSPFSKNRLDPVTGKYYKDHGGMDIGGVGINGLPVMAADNAVVLKAGKDPSYGNFVMLGHGNGYKTLYAHLSKITVKVGQVLERGDVIGNVGSTGNSTGPHLHFEIRKDNVKVDPAQFFKNLNY
ncbi:MAG: peptidoglycan DD-metalloendopeptidase family protein [Oscillospiraceae bacterium]|nr:peptidoglycan DD-metalloendopeptidase family protein [Oscillospiraceae bacterium]